LKNKTLSHRQVLHLAVPMILSNITTPLLGLVDTAVMGHLDSPQFLAAIALGGLIFSFIFWGFGFLRMGTTGLVSQAFGRNDRAEIKAVLLRAMLLAQLIAAFMLAIQQPVLQLSMYLLEGSQAVEQLTQRYFLIRIWSAPATLALYVVNGWFVGMQNVRVPLLLVLLINSSNIILDVVLVYGWQLNIDGVAMASVIAEYIGLLVALLSLRRYAGQAESKVGWQQVMDYARFRAMVVVNSHIFIRTWCVIFAFAFFTAQSSRLGEVVLATNTVLMNFQTFMAYALDGFAHAAEALVGRAVGAKNKRLLQRSINISARWSLLITVVFTLIYWMNGNGIVALLTDIGSVRQMAGHYLPWLFAMPLLSFASYLLDGIFIGAMLTRQMRDSMLFSVFLVFLPVWYLTQALGNHGLWMALAVFMLARSISMAVLYRTNMRTLLR
jgi:MATE family, multidrug efflux pump